MRNNFPPEILDYMDYLLSESELFDDYLIVKHYYARSSNILRVIYFLEGDFYGPELLFPENDLEKEDLFELEKLGIREKFWHVLQFNIIYEDNKNLVGPDKLKIDEDSFQAILPLNLNKAVNQRLSDLIDKTIYKSLVYGVTPTFKSTEDNVLYVEKQLEIANSFFYLYNDFFGEFEEYTFTQVRNTVNSGINYTVLVKKDEYFTLGPPKPYYGELPLTDKTNKERLLDFIERAKIKIEKDKIKKPKKNA